MDSIRSWVKILKRENGSGLVLTLMVLMVLSVLAVSLATITIGSYRLTAKNRSSVSAYYVAEASLNETYEEIKLLVNDTYELDTNKDTYFSMVESSINDTNGRKMANFTKQFGDNPTAEIQIKKISDGNPREYTLTSVGNVGNTTRTLTKNFSIGYTEKSNSGGLPNFPDNTAAIARSKIKLISGGSISGDVYFDSITSDSIEMIGTGRINQGTTYIPENADSATILNVPNSYNYQGQYGPNFVKKKLELPWEEYDKYVSQFPQIPTYETLPDEYIVKSQYEKHKIIDNGSFYFNNYLVNSNYPGLTLEKNVYFENFNISTGTTLKINTKGKNHDIVVNHLNIENGSIEITGGGSVTFFVKNKFTFNSGPGNNVNKNNDPSQLRILYAGSSDFVLNAGILNAAVFIKNANVNVKGSSGLSGLLISGGSVINHDGGTTSSAYVIAPKAKFNFTGSGKIIGSVIGDQIFATGGGEVRFQKPSIDLNIFYNGSKIPEGNQNIDLIESEPPIETDSN